jgi:hypothetical protein
LRGGNLENEQEWAKRLNEVFGIKEDNGTTFQSTLELIFEVLYCLFLGNDENQNQASFYLKIMQKYVFVDNIPKVLISLFQNKKHGSIKNEIHRDLLYHRIFEYERFESIVDFFVEKLK